MVISNPPIHHLQLSIIQQNNSNHTLQCTPLTQIQSIQDLKQIQAHYIKLGHIHIPYHASKLLSKCALSQWGSIDYAQSIFYGLQCPCTFDFNTMIRAHVNYGRPTHALLFYRQMLENAIKVDNFTFTFAIKACGMLSAIEEGMQIHGHSTLELYQRFLKGRSRLEIAIDSITLAKGHAPAKVTGEQNFHISQTLCVKLQRKYALSKRPHNTCFRQF